MASISKVIRLRGVEPSISSLCLGFVGHILAEKSIVCITPNAIHLEVAAHVPLIVCYLICACNMRVRNVCACMRAFVRKTQKKPPIFCRT